MAQSINNAVLIRRELLAKISRLLMDGQLRAKIDRIPIDLRPKDAPASELSRCCIYKDRAMIKYKLMALLGYNVQEEEDELIPLSDYAIRAFERENISAQPLTVIDDVCSACVKTNYVVTNMCRGCVARPCQLNCPKDAVEFRDGQAFIDHKKCINCGICQKNCPYHAIVYVPIPCEESCPVGAISQNEAGKEQIDYSKCIYCGRCVSSCPFGAVVEKSHLIDLYKAFGEGKQVVAMVAPAIAGQFKAPLPQILGAIKALGFTDVIEVAKGADETTAHEAEEFQHKMAEGQAFMTTSCCPSYTTLVKKHIPELKPFVSDTGTPMFYTAQQARAAYPDAVLVFVGPCLAKRFETYMDKNANLMLSFEEVGSMFVAAGIDVAQVDPVEIDTTIDPTSRVYPVTSGVMAAVAAKLPKGVSVNPVVINGLDKSSIRLLKSYPKSCPGNMVEVMACEGGCVSGCSVIANQKIAARQINALEKSLAK